MAETRGLQVQRRALQRRDGVLAVFTQAIKQLLVLRFQKRRPHALARTPACASPSPIPMSQIYRGDEARLIEDNTGYATHDALLLRKRPPGRAARHRPSRRPDVRVVVLGRRTLAAGNPDRRSRLAASPLARDWAREYINDSRVE